MRITQKPELGQLMTFELSKEKPIHSWFWYKEGYAPEIVDYSLSKVNAKTVLDPFCGVGTTLLACKKAGVESVGVDASPLAVFVSKTKTNDYQKEDLEAALSFLNKKLEPVPEINWGFELFDPRAAFPKRNYNEILSLRQ
ncbi:hypothetical protein HZC07_02435, partial [Candidatus Micrarchaeota archaeon]|nr:hypothetical protein [Candidatus Micrarchaeota archaeon]